MSDYLVFFVAGPVDAEAARRRRQLRDVEAERDQLRQRLDATHEAIVERTAGELFADPSDLWHATSIDGLRGDEGLIDPERAEATMNAVLEQKPHWRKAPHPVQDEQPSPSRPFTKGQGPRRSHRHLASGRG